MSTPTERIQRLREETAHATPAPWMVDDDAPQVVLKPDKPGFSWDGKIVATVPDDDFGLVEHSDSGHIARWDPQAAARALDLLEVIDTHVIPAVGIVTGGILRVASLALLDTIDPEGAA